MYTSKALWCTPVGNAGFKHCESRFDTTSLRGISLNCMYDWNVWIESRSSSSIVSAARKQSTHLEQLLQERYKVCPFLDTVERTQAPLDLLRVLLELWVGRVILHQQGWWARLMSRWKVRSARSCSATLAVRQRSPWSEGFGVIDCLERSGIAVCIPTRKWRWGYT